MSHTNEFKHISVLLEECITALAIKPDGIYIDATFGRGGHSNHILNTLPLTEIHKPLKRQNVSRLTPVFLLSIRRLVIWQWKLKSWDSPEK